MDNLKNKKYLEYRKNNKLEIQSRLRYDFIMDLIQKGYIVVSKDDIEYTVSQTDYSFYFGNEIDDVINNENLKMVYEGNTNIESIYVKEGILLDESEDIISEDLNYCLDKCINLIIEEGYTAPTFRSPCRIYSYFLDDFFNGRI